MIKINRKKEKRERERKSKTKNKRHELKIMVTEIWGSKVHPKLGQLLDWDKKNNMEEIKKKWNNIKIKNKNKSEKQK